MEEKRYYESIDGVRICVIIPKSNNNKNKKENNDDIKKHERNIYFL